jgi:hypothetical protein
VPLGFRSAGPPQVPAIRARPEVELSADALGRCRWPNGRQRLCYTVALTRFAATIALTSAATRKIRIACEAPFSRSSCEAAPLFITAGGVFGYLGSISSTAAPATTAAGTPNAIRRVAIELVPNESRQHWA